MASVIENKGEVTNLWENLDDFLESCVMNRLFKNGGPELDKSLFSGSITKKIDLFFLRGASLTLENFVHWWGDYKKDNHWIGITGSWRTINQKIVDDITEIVRYIVNHKFGILAGGALGVDYIATEIVLREGDPKSQLRVALPVKKYDYIRHLKNSALNSVINSSQLSAIANQIYYIDKNFRNVIFDDSRFDNNEFLENGNYRVDCYSFRNNLIGYACDGLIPFLVNGSKGAEDTIKMVEFLRRPVLNLDNLKYKIDPDGEEVIRDYSKLEIPNLSNKYTNELPDFSYLQSTIERILEKE